MLVLCMEQIEMINYSYILFWVKGVQCLGKSSKSHNRTPACCNICICYVYLCLLGRWQPMLHIFGYLCCILVHVQVFDSALLCNIFCGFRPNEVSGVSIRIEC